MRVFFLSTAVYISVPQGFNDSNLVKVILYYNNFVFFTFWIYLLVEFSQICKAVALDTDFMPLILIIVNIFSVIEFIIDYKYRLNAVQRHLTLFGVFSRIGAYINLC